MKTRHSPVAVYASVGYACPDDWEDVEKLGRDSESLTDFNARMLRHWKAAREREKGDN